jgi:hypothetical protein
MKMTEEVLLKLIELARSKGSITFQSDAPESDRQKLYRIKRNGNPLPLFPDEFNFSVHTTKDSVTIEMIKDPLVILLDQPVKEIKTVVEKPKRAKKIPDWITKQKHLEECAEVEQLIAQAADPKLYDWLQQRVDTRRIAVEHYIELFEEKMLKDGALIDLIKTSFSHDRYDQFVIRAFAPHCYVDEFESPMTRREQLAQRMGEIRNSQDPADIREFRRLLEEHTQLVKKEDEQWTDPKNLLG